MPMLQVNKVQIDSKLKFNECSQGNSIEKQALERFVIRPQLDYREKIQFT
jgi:hypothetical protein